MKSFTCLKKLAVKLESMTDSIPRTGEGDKFAVERRPQPKLNRFSVDRFFRFAYGFESAQNRVGIADEMIKTLNRLWRRRDQSRIGRKFTSQASTR